MYLSPSGGFTLNSCILYDYLWWPLPLRKDFHTNSKHTDNKHRKQENMFLRWSLGWQFLDLYGFAKYVPVCDSGKVPIHVLGKTCPPLTLESQRNSVETCCEKHWMSQHQANSLFSNFHFKHALAHTHTPCVSFCLFIFSFSRARANELLRAEITEGSTTLWIILCLNKSRHATVPIMIVLASQFVVSQCVGHKTNNLKGPLARGIWWILYGLVGKAF